MTTKLLTSLLMAALFASSAAFAAEGGDENREGALGQGHGVP